MYVTEKQVELEINRRIENFEKKIAPVKIEDYLKLPLAEIKERFKQPVQEFMVAQKMQELVTQDIKITPSEVKKFFAKLPKDSLPILDATFEIAQIVKIPQMTKEEKKAQREKLLGIRKRIVENGEDFKTLDVLYSEDPGSARDGGLMTGVGRSDLVPEFSSAVFNLEVDEVSDIVETEYGIHIIKLVERQGDKASFRHILLIPEVSSQAKLKARDELNSIANVIRIDTLTFAQAALKYSDDEDTRLNGGIMVNPYTGTDKFEAKHINDASINYALRDLKHGEISNAIEARGRSGQTEFKIIYLKNRTKAHTVNMKDDYQMIQDMALNKKQQDELNRWIEEKQNNTYIKLEGKYKNCKFNFPGWIK